MKFGSVSCALPLTALRCVGVSLCLLLGAGGAMAQAGSDNQDVLVSRKDMVLTKQDFEAALAVIPKAKRAQMSPSVKQAMIFLEALMVHRVLADEARALGIDKDPVTQKEVQQAVDRILSQKRLELLESSAKKPDFSAVAKERYEVKKSEYSNPETIRVSHVLVGLVGRTEQDALRLIQEVHQKAAVGENFESLVKTYSDDPSKESNKGDLGFFDRKAKLVKPFLEAAFALGKPGEISPVVKTEYGYHIIRMNEKIPATPKPFDEIKAQIIAQLEEQYINDIRAAYISTIKNDKSIVVHEAAIEAMHKK